MTKEEYDIKLRAYNQIITDAYMRSDVSSEVLDDVVETVTARQRALYEEYKRSNNIQ